MRWISQLLACLVARPATIHMHSRAFRRLTPRISMRRPLACLLARPAAIHMCRRVFRCSTLRPAMQLRQDLLTRSQEDPLKPMVSNTRRPANHNSSAWPRPCARSHRPGKVKLKRKLRQRPKQMPRRTCVLSRSQGCQPRAGQRTCSQACLLARPVCLRSPFQGCQPRKVRRMRSRPCSSSSR